MSMTIGGWIKKNSSTILTCLGAGGVIATVILAVRATPKAMDKIQTTQIDKGEEILNGDREGEVKKNGDGSYELPKLTVVETVEVCWKEYVPAAAIGIGSLACIFGANILSRRRQASLASAYTALAGSFEAYRDKVETLCGPGTNAAVEKAIKQEKKDAEEDRPPWDEVQTFYLDCCGKPIFFERTMEQVMQAEYSANRYFILNGSISLNEFLELLGLEPAPIGNEIGWEAYIGETQYGYRWIDFNHRWFVTDDRLTVCSIDMPFGPHSVMEEGEDYGWHLNRLQTIADESRQTI